MEWLTKPSRGVPAGFAPDGTGYGLPKAGETATAMASARNLIDRLILCGLLPIEGKFAMLENEGASAHNHDALFHLYILIRAESSALPQATTIAFPPLIA